MIIGDIQNEFFPLVKGQRILMLVNYDIDAICASKILQSIFKYENVTYSLVPIFGITGFKRAFIDNKNNAKVIVLINCGGGIDIIDLLKPEEDIIFFVFDSHRPLDVCNVYNDSQIRIVGDITKEDVPSFTDIFYESDSDSSDDSNKESTNPNRLKNHERNITKHRRRCLWESERDRIMFTYMQYSFYARSTSLTIFDIAWKMAKDKVDILWWAIVGLTEQLILGKIERSTYTLEIDKIQSHVSRLCYLSDDTNNQTVLKIQFESDLNLALYRHWSIEESMRCSLYPSCKLKLWKLHGKQKLNELFVEMGLPLEHAKQTFNSMDIFFRQEFFHMIEKFADKYGIPDIAYGSFILTYGYRSRYSAADYVYAMLAALIGKDENPEYSFMKAFDSLSRDHKELLLNEISNAKVLLSGIFCQVQNDLESHLVHSTGSFFYYVIKNTKTFIPYPYGLTLLGKFILHAFVSNSGQKRSAQMPLIACCTLDDAAEQCLLVGIPPVLEDSTKNLFGKAFEQAALESNSTVLRDFFDSSLIQIQQNHLPKFLDALTVILT